MGNAEYMGAQLASAHSALNMKLLVVLALAAIAAAEPEAEAKAAADPYLYGYGGYGLGYGYGLGGYYGKREAEAAPKAEADPTFCMVVDTMVMDWDTTVLATGVCTMARGRLRLPLRLRLTLTFCMVDTMDWDTEDTTVFTDIMATTMARGRLRLPPRLRLTPTFCMVDMVLDMVILATATVLATGDTTGDKLPTPLQDLNHRRKTLTLFV